MKSKTLKTLVASSTLAVAVLAFAAPANAQYASGERSSSYGERSSSYGERASSESGERSSYDREEKKEKKTIVEIAAGNDDFSTLVSLVESAGLVDVLNQSGPFTVFAPTNEAFAKLPEELISALGEDADTLRAVLTYHVAAGSVNAEQVANVDQVRTVQGEAVRVKAYDGKVKLNNATVTTADVMASNGVIHIIDTVILPPSIVDEVSSLLGDAAEDYAMATERPQDIVDIAASNGNFNTLATLLAESGLIETLRSEGPFTVFAPTDEAFAQVPAETLEALANDADALRSVLLYHVAPGAKKAEEVVSNSTIRTAQGTDAQIRTYGETVRINNARITATDIEASNGVIHVIDAVIMPEQTRTAAAPAPAPRTAY